MVVPSPDTGVLTPGTTETVGRPPRALAPLSLTAVSTEPEHKKQRGCGSSGGCPPGHRAPGPEAAPLICDSDPFFLARPQSLAWSL